MSDYKKEFSGMGEFLGFFGQDWKIMFEWEERTPDYRSAVRKLKIDSSESDYRKTLDAIERLVERNFDENKLSEIINGDFGSAFYPPGLNMTYQDWLKDVLTILKETPEQTKKHFLPKFVGEA